MKFETLAQFLVIVEKGSISEAARTLHTTQPALSLAVRSLEQELGTQLLVREARRVFTTSAGEELARFAQQALDLERQFRTRLAELEGRVSGKLVMATGETSGIYIAPWVVSLFHRSYPDVEMTINVLSAAELNNVLKLHLCDLALTATDLSASGFEVVKFFTESYELIVPRNHPWAERPAVELTELCDIPLVTRDERSSSRRELERALTQAGVDVSRLQVVLRLGSNEAVKTAVEAGLGAGFVSRCSLRATDLGYVRLPIAGLKLERPIWLVRNPDRGLTYAARRLWDFVQSQHVAELLESTLLHGT